MLKTNICTYTHTYIRIVWLERTGAYRCPSRRERKRGHFSASGALPAPPAAGARAPPLPGPREALRPGETLRAASADVRAPCAEARAARAERSWCRIPAAPLFPRGAPAEGEGWGGQPETTRRTASRSKSRRLESDKNPGDGEFYPVHSRCRLTLSPA